MASTGISSVFSPGWSEFLFIEISEYPPEWHKFVTVENMETAYVDEQGFQNYPLPPIRMPGEPVQMASFIESFNVRYVPNMFSMGDSIPYEDIRDDLYRVLTQMLPSKGSGFGRMFRVLTEITMANLFANYGFVSGAVPFGPDGVSLFNTNHPTSRQNPTPWANRPYVDVDLSTAAYNAAYTNLRTQRGPNGIEMVPNKPRHLVVNPNNRTMAQLICHNPWQVNSANRNENIIVNDNVECVEWNYFQSSGVQGALTTPAAYNTWMMFGEQHWCKFFWREMLTTDNDSDILTRSEIFTGHMAFAQGWSDPRGVYASLGL